MSTTLKTLALAVSIALLAACGDSAPPPAAPSQPAAGAAPAAPAEEAQPIQITSQETVEQILARANEALAADRLFEPAGDSALEYYLAAIEKAEAEAATSNGDKTQQTRRLSDAMASADLVSQTRLAVSDILPYGLVWVERAITAGNRAGAARVLALLEKAQPGASSLQRLRTQLAEAEAEEIRVAERAAAAAAEREAAAAAAAARPAEPEPTPVATPAAPPPETPAATPAESRPAPVAAATPPAAQPAPTTPAATPPAALAPGAQPRLISQPELRYPTQALRRQTEGFVEVSFTINPDGSTSNVEVTRANPRNVFEREAIRVVGGLKFQPPGRAIQSQRRIDFKLER